MESSYCKRGSIHKKIFKSVYTGSILLLCLDILYMTPPDGFYYCYCCSGEVAHDPLGFYCVFSFLYSPKQTLVLQSTVHAFRNNYNLNASVRTEPTVTFSTGIYTPVAVEERSKIM